MRNLMRVVFAACALALVAGGTPADDKKKDDKAKPFTDAMFMSKAESGGLHEVALGKMTKTNAASADVKAFGERMVTDHTKANAKLIEAAREAGIKPRTTMLPDHQAHVDRLFKLTGAEFDKAYMEHMVKDHKEDVALFEKAAKEAKDEKVKAFAAETLPTLKEHLKMAEKANAAVKGDK